MEKMNYKIGVADTMFASTDMFKFVEKTIENIPEKIEIERYTVPGIKDLPVACKILLEEYNCDIAIALGMVGRERIDEICAHEASTGIISAQLLTNKHIFGVFIHQNESKNDKEIYAIAKDRTIKHTINAVELLKGHKRLSKFAGQGKRQGSKDVGQLRV